jgi:hypothetical protein
MDGMILWSPGTTLEAVEKQVILMAFRHFRGEKTSTARALGIAIRTLDDRLDKYAEDGKKEKERQDNERIKHEEFLTRQRGQTLASSPHIPPSPDPRLRMESIANSAKEQALSVQEQQKVQTVLPKQVAESGSKKGRGSL